MARVTPETLQSEHVKGARIMLDWSVLKLSLASSVGTRTIKHFEAGHSVTDKTKGRLIEALEKAGVELGTGKRVSVSIPANDTPPEKDCA